VKPPSPSGTHGFRLQQSALDAHCVPASTGMQPASPA